MPSDFLDGLNDAQRQAVVHGDGPLLVLAGPGSGKTRVITCRVAHLLDRGVPPWQVLAITFTNKAAGEMRERIEAMVGRAGVWVSTFHSMCVRLLRRYAEPAGIQANFSIYDTDDRVQCIKGVMKELEIDATHWRPAAVEAEISRAKNDMHSAESYKEHAKDFFRSTVAKVFTRYEQALAAANALDFDDLLLVMANLVKDNADVRAELDARFRYVLVDEYQDTNLAQYAIARALSIDFPNICATGDPDQSIYGWRGANIGNILRFEDDYPDATVVRLEQNYRSTKMILHVADCVIQRNTQRKHKTLWTDNDAGKEVTVLELEDEQAEADDVAERIRQYVGSGGAYRDVAVFFRINALTRPFEQSLRRLKIPYQMVGGVEFFHRKEIRDVLAYLRLVANPQDNVAFARVVNVPTRGIGAATLARVVEFANARGVSLGEAAAEADRVGTLGARPAKKVQDFARMLQGWRDARLETVEDEVRRVLEGSGYRQMLAKSRDPADEERLANIEELISAASQYDAERPEEGSLEEFLEQVSLASDIDDYEADGNLVTLMTLHSAKGLEFPVVFVAAVEDGLLPHSRSIEDRHELEEERRLCFVGMTRAMRELYLTHVQYRMFRGQLERATPSRFLDELPADGVVVERLTGAAPSTDLFGRRSDGDLIADEEPDYDTFEELGVGMLVRHAEFGLGRIVAIDGFGKGRKATVRFNIVGQKRLVLEYANLEPAE